MKTKQHSRADRLRHAVEPAGGAAGDAVGPGSVTVASGPYTQTLPIAGMRVHEVRTLFRDRFNLAPQAEAFLDGNPADENTVVHDGQTLLFMHRAAQKGAMYGYDTDRVTPRI